jgi:peptidoglycan/xylan/chitin deacetylase (PgdA/CDA1 family)
MGSASLKTKLRDGGLKCVAKAGLLDLAQLVTGSQITVLLYHSVASGENTPYFGGQELARHLDMLRAECRVLGAEEYLWHLQAGGKFPRRSVLITFDDGFENNASVVQPLMEAYQMPWVLFVTTAPLEEPGRFLWFSITRAICLYAPPGEYSFLGRTWQLDDRASRLQATRQLALWARTRPADDVQQETDRWQAAYWKHVPAAYVDSFCRMMSADQLRELGRSPLVEIGCHTRMHPFLPQVADGKLADEIDRPTAYLADVLGRRIRMFAYPAGAYGVREINHLAKLGFDCAFAVIPNESKTGRYDIPRVGIFNPSVDLVRAKALGLVDVFRRVGWKKS